MRISKELVVAVVASAVAAIAVTAYATIPSTSGTITGCVDARGSLAVVDADASCGAGRKPLIWNRQGPAGPPGTALGYATVADDGTVLSGKNLGASPVVKTGVGTYCFELPYKPSNLVASPEALVRVAGGAPVVQASTGPLGCPAGSDAVVKTRNSATGRPIDAAFSVLFN
jgi:hypothetical protein